MNGKFTEKEAPTTNKPMITAQNHGDKGHSNENKNNNNKKENNYT